tara:strand:+ start:7699 stop:8478 length:780 start_codon:yes stop_codon:yes gene_type:complete
MNIHKVKKKYLQDQVYLYKNLFSKKDFQELDGVFRTYLEKFFNYKTQNKNFIFQNKKLHNFLLRKRKNNIYLFRKLYNTIQISSTIYRFLNSNKIIRVASQLIGCKPEQLISTGNQLRIDVPHDKKHRLNWHYDFYKYENKIKFNIKSGLILWIPLQDVNKDLGTLEYLKNSYQLKRSSKTNSKGYNIIKLKKSMIDGFEKKKVEANLGDAFIQSFLILHQSGFNMSDKIRFTLIGRYLNIENKNFKGLKKSMEPLSLY